MNKIIKKTITFILIIIILGLLTSATINEYVITSTKDYFLKSDELYSNIDCIMVLGAGVKGSEPSSILKDRLDKSIELYKKGYSKKIIMSGDHGQENYDEVNVMKAYAIKKGVRSEDIFMDHAGFSTYDSVYRAKEIFGVKKMIIVSQKYHLYRAIYLAKILKIDAIGSPAEDIKYSGETSRNIREFLARNKDFIKGFFLPPSTYLGKTIPVDGDGNITND